ncbi:MAG: SDR family oxidoreductase [Acidimicrobiales bacterium]
MSRGLCEGRVAIVTGSGRGLGRAHALELARQGAALVVNDLGAEADGTGASSAPANEVVEEIRGMGGQAVANGADVASTAGADELIATALTAFGRLDVLVNNAGILRDRMIINMTDDDWDSVTRVHLRGTFAPTRAAARHWRELTRKGESVEARVINTSSTSGLFGNVGQSNYGAAKAGIASFTIIAAKELGRYGVTVNAISPAALTRMTQNPDFERRAAEARKAPIDKYDPHNLAPIVAWLGSTESAPITGRVFLVFGDRIGVLDAWDRGPTAWTDQRWHPADLGPLITDLVGRAAAPTALREPND